MSYQVSCCHLHTPLYIFFLSSNCAVAERQQSCHCFTIAKSDEWENLCCVIGYSSDNTSPSCVSYLPFQSVRSYSFSLESPLNSYIFVWGLVRLEGQNHVKKKKKKEDVPSDLAGWAEMHSNVRCELQSVVSLDPIWFYLQWSYEVWTSPQRLQGEGRWCIEGRHDEAEERRRVG